MLNIIVDTEIVDVRERAKAGNFDSMACLADCLIQGYGTAQNLKKANKIYDYLLERKDELIFHSTYWSALFGKSNIYWQWNQWEVVDNLLLKLVRHMAQCPPEQWEAEKMKGAIQWLCDRQIMDHSIFG